MATPAQILFYTPDRNPTTSSGCPTPRCLIIILNPFRRSSYFPALLLLFFLLHTDVNSAVFLSHDMFRFDKKKGHVRLNNRKKTPPSNS